MDINWSRYIEIARAQDLGSAEVARLIRRYLIGSYLNLAA